MKGLLNINFGVGRFHGIPQSYQFSHRFCWNNFLQVCLLVNQRYQVSLLIFINRTEEVYRLVRGSKVIGDKKYLMNSDKQLEEAVRIWTKDN